MTNTPNSNHAATRLVAFDARTERVMELRRQILEGTYTVDHRAIAAAMLRQHVTIDAAFEPSAPAVPASSPAIRDFSRFLVAPTAPEEPEVSVATA